MAPRTIALLAALFLIACGGSGKKYYIPVDSPDFKPFVPPEADDLGDDDGDDWGDDDDDDDGDGDGGETTPPTSNTPNTPKTPSTDAGAAPAGGAVKVVLKDGDKATASGGLAKSAIKDVIAVKRAQFKMCYERELIRDPSLSGTVKVGFVIKSDGTVTDVASSGLAVVDACVGKIIGALTFPRPSGKGTVRVSYPFVFTASK